MNEYSIYRDLDKFIKSLYENKLKCAETLGLGNEVKFHGDWDAIYTLSVKEKENVVMVNGNNEA